MKDSSVGRALLRATARLVNRIWQPCDPEGLPPAADWWWQADGRYGRDVAPSIGSVLPADCQWPRCRGVISQILGAQQILVTQANWVHSRVSEDQPVIDVSSANDWSIVRVWWPPTDRPATHDQLIAATPRAIRLAANE